MPGTLDRIWAMSNRQDDRVVLFEKDPEHPGGECFIGGPGVDYIAKTAAVEDLLRRGLMIEVPEPPKKINNEDNRKYPVLLDDVDADNFPNQPGQAIKLGRTPDPELVPEGAMKSVEAQQAKAPTAIPSTATVPPQTPSVKS